MRELACLVVACLLLGFPLESRAAAPDVAEVPPPLFGTGHVYVGPGFGLRMPLFDSDPVKPELLVHVTGPIGLRPPRVQLEWLGILGADYERYSQVLGNGENRGWVLHLSLIPGGRVLLPVRRRFFIHADAGLGPIWWRGAGRTHFTVAGKETDIRSSGSDFGAVYRVAVGAVIPATEQLRFSFTPLAYQGYRGIERSGGLSPQLLVTYALN